jgi:HlyD family secretion protein
MIQLTGPETTSRPAGPQPHTPQFRRWWIVGGALLILIAGVTIYMRVRPASAPNYVTATVDRGTIEATVTTTGNLNAVITVQVGSQVSGNIIALYADFNTKVNKGQLVAEIDPAPFKASVDQASASLAAAKAAVVTAQAGLAKSKADLATAEANVAAQKANVAKAKSAVELARLGNERRQEMVKSGSTSQEDADTAKANYEQAIANIDAVNAAVKAAESSADSARKGIDVAQNQLDQAKAVVLQDQAILSQAELNLAHTRILAPVDGTVESRNMDVGQTVAASFQAPTIFLIAQDLTRMQVDTNVDEADIGRIRLDQPATFTVDAWPGQIFRGRVAQIRKAPINVQNVITYDVVVQVSNEELKLFPGMTANVTVAVGRAENVVRLPKAALRFRPRGTPGANRGAPGVSSMQNVSVLAPNGQLRQIAVKTGLSDANYIEVVSGDLKEGERVVVGMSGQTATSTSPAPQPGRRMGF